MVFSAHHWLRKLLHRNRPFVRRELARRLLRSRLRLEQLEVRWVPSVATLGTFNPFPNGFHPAAGLVADSHGNLYGTVEQFGPLQNGTVFEVAAGSGTISTLAAFNGSDGADPRGGLILDGSGNLFGTTASGGANNDGTVFELASGSSSITTLANFNGSNGAGPCDTLVRDVHGNLFGTTQSGGTNNDGTVFELAGGSGPIISLASFNGTNGANPYAGLVIDSAGNLFGTTVYGAASNDGVVFEIAAGSSTITTLASCSGSNGQYPYGGLVEDAQGDLFGTTYQGGANGGGTVFEVGAGSGAITTIIDLNWSNGQNPYAGLFADNKGNLFGTGFTGGAHAYGTVFEVATGNSSIATLASFADSTDGAYPKGGVVEDSSGNLFGTTWGGAVDTVFEVVSGSGTITTLASFNSTVGSTPEASVIEDNSGNVFGTTNGGGTYNDGTIYEVVAGSGNATTLVSFNGSNGTSPNATLVEDTHGNLFGVATGGGAAGRGTVFELTAGSHAVTTLVTFNGANGAYPGGSLIEDAAGNFFGVTHGGGANGWGTVFELSMPSGTITTLASFNGSNGEYPEGSLLEDSQGNLFGTATSGGAFGDGTVFEIAAGSGSINTLASFNGLDGSGPGGSLIEDNRGDLFGIAGTGGTWGRGAVFEVVAGSGTVTNFASFNFTDGWIPSGGLIVDAGGDLLGTTQLGGSIPDSSETTDAHGTVFEIAAGTATITDLTTFDVTDGALPVGLFEDQSGNLLGATFEGGMYGFGTVFEFQRVATTAEASNQSVAFGAASQSVTLNALITSTNHSGVNEGTVLFSVYSGSTQIGTSIVSGTVVNGAATATYVLPAGTPPGVYSIHVSYSGGAVDGASNNFGDVTFPTLTVIPASTTVEAISQSALFSPSTQSVTLTAIVNSGTGGTPNVGTVTFSVYNGATQIGSSVTSGTVSGGSASATYTLPGGIAPGAYTIHVSYSGSGNYTGSNNFADTTFPTLTVYRISALVYNGQPGYSQTAGFTTYSDPNAYGGVEAYALAGTGANTATWSVPYLLPGSYNVEVTWTAYVNRATNATYKVYDGATLLGTVMVDQTQAPSGGMTLGGVAFQNFGRFTITSGILTVVLSDNANYFVIANAVDVQAAMLPAVVDNSQYGYSETGGGWTSFSDPSAYLGNERYAAPGVGNNTATWQTTGLAAGVYDVQVDWTPYVNRADNATYKVFDGATLLATVQVDQQLAPQAGATVGGVTFQSLGRFSLGSGTLKVVLSDNADGYVIADAMLVELATFPAVVDNSQGGYTDAGGGWASFIDANAYFGNERYVAPGTGTNTATWQAPGLAPGIYDVQVDWTAFANRATNATYQIYDGTTLLGTATIDQTKSPTGGATINGITFQSLGRFTINSGTVKVVLSDNANGYVIADAMLAEVATLPAVIDNSQGGYSDSGGGWASFNDPNAYLGNERYVAPGAGSNTATWQTAGLASGPYNVYVDWTPFAGRATNATYQIFDGTTLLATTSIDQTHAPSGDVVLNGVPFQSLGRFPITSGTVKVVLSDNANGYVIADAMYVKVATGQVVVDNGQYGYAETGTGWTSFNDPNAFNGNERYAAPGTGANTATWSVPDLAAGTYNVQADWTAYANRATNATYQIFDGATLLGTVTVNQQLTPTGGSTVNGVTFQSLGQFTISSGTLRVVLTDNANGYVIADAMLAM
jgi:uncharacterized repeat protein (TIGR03803 family)